eukprot:scaffold990_cov393-Prasinococcus_capsulatus_cf.AAC.29
MPYDLGDVCIKAELMLDSGNSVLLQSFQIRAAFLQAKATKSEGLRRTKLPALPTRIHLAPVRGHPWLQAPPVVASEDSPHSQTARSFCLPAASPSRTCAFVRRAQHRCLCCSRPSLQERLAGRTLHKPQPQGSTLISQPGPQDGASCMRSRHSSRSALLQLPLMKSCAPCSLVAQASRKASSSSLTWLIFSKSSRDSKTACRSCTTPFVSMNSVASAMLRPLGNLGASQAELPSLGRQQPERVAVGGPWPRAPAPKAVGPSADRAPTLCTRTGVSLPRPSGRGPARRSRARACGECGAAGHARTLWPGLTTVG